MPRDFGAYVYNHFGIMQDYFKSKSPEKQTGAYLKAKPILSPLKSWDLAETLPITFNIH